MMSSVKLPILKKVQMTKDKADNEIEVPHVTTHQILARKRERKAESTLLMAWPDEHFARFHGIKDAKTLWAAIKTRFGGVSTEDANQKFLRYLPSAWSNISLIMRNKPAIDNLDIDDLYNNLKVYEANIKGSSGSSSNSQNVAFASTERTSITNELNAAYNVSTATCHSSQAQGSSSYANELMFSFFANQPSSPQLDNEELNQIDQDDLEEMDLKWQVAMLSMRVKRFYKKTRRKLEFNRKEQVGFDKTRVECSNCHKRWHFSRNCSSARNSRNMNRDVRNARYRGRDNGKRSAKKEDEKALVGQDGLDRMAKKSVLPTNVGKGTGHKESRPVWNNVQRINHENKFAPTTIFTRPKQSVNFSKSGSTFHKSHSLIKRSFYNATSHSRRNSTERVKTVGSKAVSAVKGNRVTAVTTSAGYVWRPRVNEIDQLSKDNRALVIKTHNKTPYELLNGRTPRLDFMRPFGCLVTILNTLDPLGKFEVSVENQTDKNEGPQDTTSNEGTQDNVDVGKEVYDQHYIVLPLWYSIFFTNSSDYKAEDDKTKDDIEKEASDSADALRKESKQGCMDQRGASKADSTNPVNTISNPVNAASTLGTFSVGGPTSPHPDAFIPSNTLLHADFNNMESSTIISPIPIHRVHLDHRKDQILGDPKSVVQRRRMAKKSFGVHAFVSYIHKQRRTNHKIMRTTYLLASSHIWNPKRYLKPLMMKAGLRGIIDKTLFIKKDKDDIMPVQVYVDDIIFGSTKNSLCDEFEALMHKRFQISSMAELTFFLRLQVKQSEEGIFISQDKFQVTPKLSHLHDVKWIFRKSTTGGYQFLGRRLISWQCKKQTIVAASTIEAVLALEEAQTNQDKVITILKLRVRRLENKRKGRTSQPMKRRLFKGRVEAPTDKKVCTVSVPVNVSAATPSTPLTTTTTIFGNEGLTIAQTLIKLGSEKAKVKGVAFIDMEEPPRLTRSTTTLQPLPTIDPKDKGKGVLVEEEPKKLEKVKRKDQGLAQIECDADLAQRIYEEELAEVLALEEAQTNQDKVITILKLRVRRLENKRKGRTSQPMKRRLFKGRVEAPTDKKVCTVSVPVNVSAATPSTPLTTTTTIFGNEGLTIAQTLIKLGSEKAKVKGVAFIDMEEPPRLTRSTTTLQPLPTIDPKDKGKGVLVEEEPKKLEKVKRKDQGLAQIECDADLAQRIYEEELAELDRAQKEKQKQEAATIVVLTQEFDEIQARIDADHELAYKTLEELQKPYQKEQKWINDFILMDFEKEEKKSVKPESKVEKGKRIKIVTDSALKQKSSKKQKMMQEQEFVKGNVDMEDLHVCKIIRANGNTSYHKSLSSMLRKFDRQDLVDLHILVMKRFEYNTPEGYNLLLWGDFKSSYITDGWYFELLQHVSREKVSSHQGNAREDVELKARS
nr:ribonuclease H-like domain-containing protein [Tanacetum cinerariifolium]